MTPSDRFRAAVAALSSGDAAAAHRHAQQLLKDQPGNASAHQLMGVAAVQAGDPVVGAEHFRRAIAAGADTIDNRFNLARSLADSGAAEAALTLCEAAGDADRPEFQRLRADTLAKLGRRDASVAAYERLVVVDPGNFEHWNNLGNARHAAGNLEEGLDALLQARERNPQSSLVLINIARILTSLDRYADACLVYEQAAQLDPSDPVPLLDLGRGLIALDHADRALPALGSAARLDPHNPDIFVAIASAFTALEQPGQAEQALRVARRVAPQSRAALLNLGILLERENRVTDLDALIIEARAAGLDGGELDYLQALVMRRRGAVVEALALARKVESDAIDAAVLQHLIGQLADRVGDTDTAFAAFDEMNRTLARTPLGMAADADAYRRAIERATTALTSEWVDGWTPAAPTHERPSPVFLVGFPRSGTTLLDTFLLGHPAVHVIEELPILEAIATAVGDQAALDKLDAVAVAALRARYFEELDRRAPPPAGATVIDKNPLSILSLPLIHRIFPDARIILAMRHPLDVVLSCWMQDFRPTEAMANFLDLGNAARTYDKVFRFYEKARSHLPVTVHELRYEAMVADPEASLRATIAFLGLEWREGILDHQRTAAQRGHIRTPSYAQVTEPVYARASGRWRRYQAQLAPVLPTLVPWCERYGYALD